MKLMGMNPVCPVSGLVTAVMLALGLTACGEKAPPPPVAMVAPPAITVGPAPEIRTTPPQKAPEPPQAAADRALALKVKDALVREPLINGHGIDVVARNGVVTLFGTAETRMKRDVAGNVASNVAGVVSVENKLAVVAGS
jgi:hyperosmotically inducible protein